MYVCWVEVSGMRGSGGLRRIVNFNFGTYCENLLMMSVSGFIIAMTQSRLLKSFTCFSTEFLGFNKAYRVLKGKGKFPGVHQRQRPEMNVKATSRELAIQGVMSGLRFSENLF